jgi:hypothetical protein
VSDESRPEGVMAALGDAGPCPTVVFAGKTWTIGHPTQRAKAELEKLVVEVAAKNLDDLKGVLPKAKWKEKEDKFDALLLARQWQTWGSLWSEVNNGPQSQALFLLSLARPHHPDMTVADAESLWINANRACRTALVLVVPGFFDLLTALLPAEEGDRQIVAERMKAEFLASLERATLTA